MSANGKHGLTIIAFIGSVFSPYYAWARRHGAADPHNHCALNVALYGAAGKRWSMTERGRGALNRDRSSLVIGPSAMTWDGNGLTILINEVTVPVPSRLRGTVRVIPSAVLDQDYPLDKEHRHRWRPIAPISRIEMAFERPELSWSGRGYFDCNCGAEPLESAFSNWSWSRTGECGRTRILYDIEHRGSGTMSLALEADAAGAVRRFEAPPQQHLPATFWRIARQTRTDAGSQAKVAETLEDAPFYARSLINARLHGDPVTAVHESLSLERFQSPAVQAMLPFRMPRAWS